MSCLRQIIQLKCCNVLLVISIRSPFRGNPSVLTLCTPWWRGVQSTAVLQIREQQPPWPRLRTVLWHKLLHNSISRNSSAFLCIICFNLNIRHGQMTGLINGSDIPLHTTRCQQCFGDFKPHRTWLPSPSSATPHPLPRPHPHL